MCRTGRGFDALRDGLSEVLSLVGLMVNEKGQVAIAPVATTLDEVARLAGRLQNELKRRSVHDQVIYYCEEEILRKLIFHAVFDVTKGVAERLRGLSSATVDGVELVDHCFSTKVPRRASVSMTSARSLRCPNTRGSPTC